jgi:hypothetical protein
MAKAPRNMGFPPHLVTTLQMMLMLDANRQATDSPSMAENPSVEAALSAALLGVEYGQAGRRFFDQSVKVHGARAGQVQRMGSAASQPNGCSGTAS